MNEFATMVECDGTYNAVNDALDNIDDWVKPERKAVPLLQVPGLPCFLSF
jgi:hypothetical protein